MQNQSCRTKTMPGNEFQLIDHALSFLENRADTLVIAVHAGLDLRAVEKLMQDETTDIGMKVSFPCCP